MHTEDEAKQRTCPYRQPDKVVEQEDDTTLRHVVTNESRCLASACMAWRWADRYPPQFSADDTGYCGQAGKP